jgi:hypothetical protein
VAAAEKSLSYAWTELSLTEGSDCLFKFFYKKCDRFMSFCDKIERIAAWDEPRAYAA